MSHTCTKCGNFVDDDEEEDDYYRNDIINKINEKFKKVLKQLDDINQNIYCLRYTLEQLQTNIILRYGDKLKDIFLAINDDINTYAIIKNQIEDILVQNITDDMKYPNDSTVVSRIDFLRILHIREEDHISIHNKPYIKSIIKNFPVSIMDIDDIKKLIY